jgi:cyclin A
MSCWAAGRRSSAENAGAGGANNKQAAARARKRVALGDITNVFRGRGRSASSAPAPEAVRL